MKSGTKISMIM